MAASKDEEAEGELERSVPNRYQTDSAVRVVASSADRLLKIQEVPDVGVGRVRCYSAAVEPMDSAVAEAEHRKTWAEEERVHRTMMAVD